MANIPLEFVSKVGGADVDAQMGKWLGQMREGIALSTKWGQEGRNANQIYSNATGDLTRVTRESVKAQEELAAATKRAADAAKASNPSLEDSGQALQRLHRAAGPLNLVLDAFKERQELMARMTEKATDAIRDQADAFVEAASNAADYNAAQAVLASASLGGTFDREDTRTAIERQAERSGADDRPSRRIRQAPRRRSGGQTADERAVQVAESAEGRAQELRAHAIENEERYQERIRGILETGEAAQAEIRERGMTHRAAVWERQREQAALSIETERRFGEQRRRALMADAQAAGQLSGLAAEALGLSEQNKLIILGVSEAAQSLANFAAFNYLGGAAHGLASVIAFKGAADVARSSTKSSGSGRSSSAGSSIGAGGAFASTGGGSGGGGGGGAVTLNIYTGQALDTKDTIAMAMRQGLIHAANLGMPLPSRTLEAA